MPRYAAIDIGSNSIRMLAAEVVPGSPSKTLASSRQVTRLGESVFRTGKISQSAMDLCSNVLAQMAEEYRGVGVVGVRALGTSALRDASNQEEFLKRASEALQAPVEVISGQEEARLIHLGVQSRWPHPTQRVLMIDVGGGSAELILSEHGRMVQAFSKQLGALRLKEVFLKSDPPGARELHRLEEYIQERIIDAVRLFGSAPYDRAIATSATPAAMICAVNRIPRAKRDTADRLRASLAQVRKFYQDVSTHDLDSRRKIPGIGPKRAEIIVPGVALLLVALREFRLRNLYYSSAGLRDGIIADLAARRVGRELSQLDADQRRLMTGMTRRYGVPLKHARKVAALAHTLFDSLQSLHGLPPGYGKALEAASYLHDTGHYISDTRHHRHSYYLVANSDMPGFTERERLMIANLCRYHRKSIPNAAHAPFQALDAEGKRAVTLLTPLLRLADSLDRSNEQRVESVECQVKSAEVILRLQSGADVDLEQWAGERVADVFREAYGHELVITRSRR
jgi:exopolyphosphatase / guanosine-5'-triphosphate,3'-diphosphate pyrophosphatase